MASEAADFLAATADAAARPSNGHRRPTISRAGRVELITWAQKEIRRLSVR